MTINDTFICNLVNHAEQRVIYVAPGVSKNVGESILQFISRNGYDNVEVIIDANTEVCRLGYGDIEAVEMLLKKELILRKCNSIRIGVII
jgi:hypothetical protein